jgi:tryptophan synthase alpha chain
MFRNGIDQAFSKLKTRRRKALIAYLAAGYPTFGQERKLVEILQNAGVDILEVGIPFSDPIADGPTIQFASQESLAAGTTLKKILKWIAGFQPKITMPVVIMSYMNPLLAYGLSRFAKKASEAGVTGLIVPDLIPEESEPLRKIFDSHKIHLIHLVAPTTPEKRQREISRKTGGFLYAVSVAGVTGARNSLPEETKSWLARLRRGSRVPVCVGFGISDPKQVRALAGSVDGFIVGSALIDIIRKTKMASRGARLGSFIKKLAKECANGH